MSARRDPPDEPLSDGVPPDGVVPAGEPGATGSRVVTEPDTEPVGLALGGIDPVESDPGPVESDSGPVESDPGPVESDPGPVESEADELQPAAVEPREVVAAGSAVDPVEPPPIRTRTRLLAAMRPRANRGQILAAVLCAGLGFGLVAQVQQTQGDDLSRLRQSDLVRLLNDVSNEAERLQAEERDLSAVREKLLDQADAGAEAQRQARSRLGTLGILSGTQAAVGPGIELVIDDPKATVDAATLLDALQELRDAGAEAVQIGTVRVVASTAFVDGNPGVRVGGTVLQPPYRYRVIGDPDTLDAAMRIPGGVLDVLEQKGAAGRVDTPGTVIVDALHRPAAPQYARPAPDSTP